MSPPRGRIEADVRKAIANEAGDTVTICLQDRLHD
jgi:hypothetical protein